ncbi:DUF3027 domain-containing protein [Frankia sp. R43]|uniref:DUF3027 domain-containing protein n=1 Tax=Frankia sp. R43 TaxID=269536 RepID=UPI000B0ABDAA
MKAESPAAVESGAAGEAVAAGETVAVGDAGAEAAPPQPRAGRASRTARELAPDAVCATAVDLARAAAEEEAGDAGAVGEHLGVEAEAERLVLHRFACLSPAYAGWAWTVAVARASRIRKPTVNDVVLMPGEGALLAPAWVPWSERLRPGDVGVGDLLPTAVDDARLTLRAGDALELDDADVWMELGLGRPRILSPAGREDTAQRWYGGEAGPEASIAKVAPASCLTCGFHVRLAGVLGRMFGVCANEFAPDDGRVTAIDHGCGAHSEALVAPSAHPEPVPFDEDPSDLVPTDIELVGVAAHAPGSVPDSTRTPGADSADPEPYGHS